MKLIKVHHSEERHVVPQLVLAAGLALSLSLSPGLSSKAFAQENLEEVEDKVAKDSSTEINVKNADIAAIVRIFSKKTKRNYILDERVKGKVSIYLPGKVSSEEANRILDSVLSLKGFTSVPIGDNLWKIVSAREAQQTTIPTVLEDIEGRGSPAVVTKLLHLRHVGADEVKQLFGPLVSSNGLMNAYTGTNSLIIIDSGENISRLSKLIESVDVPFTDQEMTIIPIKFADANDIAEKVQEILQVGNEEGNSQASSPSATNAARARLSSSATNAAKTPAATGSSSLTVNARAREPKIIADERTNSVIVVADDETTARIRALVSELDSSVDLSGTRFYVYRCKHASAEELAEVLSGLSDGGGSSSRSTSSGSRSTIDSSTGRNVGSRSRGNRSQRTQDRLTGQNRTPGRSRSENQTGSGGVSSVSLGEEISITADPATNSLIISAGKSDYEKIRELLTSLDVKRRQVLVEAVLLEVGIDDTVNTGFEWLVSGGGADGGIVGMNNAGGLSNILSDPTSVQGFTMAAATSGTLTLPMGLVIPSQTALLTAAESNSNINVLSSPNILATDNEQAEIVVGQNVPFLASTSTSEQNLNNTFNQIDRQDVGITLRLTPQINSQDFVTLQIFTEVSNVLPGTLQSELGPVTTVRTSETTVITKSDQMVVTGGLIADDIQESEEGVPWLKDVPVFGQFFKQKTDRQRKTNLLILITPRILRDQFDMRDQTLGQRDDMQGVINGYDVFPPRQDVLANDDLDKVIEPIEYTGEKPTTILPPERSSLKRKTSRTLTVQGSKNGASDEVLELKVSPPLPEFQKSSAEQAPSPKASAKLEERDIAAPNKATRKQEPLELRVGKARAEGTRRAQTRGGRFIVLESIGSKGTPGAVPFKLNDTEQLLALAIPENSNSKVKNFFQTGQVYSYKSGDGALGLRVMGVFPSQREAEMMHQSVSQHWHALSPYEIMSLGQGPWMQGLH